MTRVLLGLLLLAAAVGASAQELGRLFLTPEQRAALEARRTARLPDKPAAVVAAPMTRVDGYVKRSRGPSTVWVNGELVPEQAPEAPRIDAARDSVSVTIGETGGRRTLKPGQTFDRATGEVHDVLGDGRIDVRGKARP